MLFQNKPAGNLVPAGTTLVTPGLATYASTLEGWKQDNPHRLSNGKWFYSQKFQRILGEICW